MDKDPRIYLEHILEAALRLEGYVKGYSFQKFSKDQKTIAATVKEIQEVGEAANNVPRNFQETYPDLPWKDMISTRNRLIHGYYTIDLNEVWKICKEDIPILKEQLQKILHIQ